MNLVPIELPPGDGLTIQMKGLTSNGTPFTCLHNPSLVGDVLALRKEREMIRLANYIQYS